MKRFIAPILGGLLAGLLAFLAVPGSPAARPQAEQPPVKLSEVPKGLAPVDFIAQAPAIDGVLDPGLGRLRGGHSPRSISYGPARSPSTRTTGWLTALTPSTSTSRPGGTG
jgi:hypothetical protein